MQFLCAYRPVRRHSVPHRCQRRVRPDSPALLHDRPRRIDTQRLIPARQVVIPPPGRRGDLLAGSIARGVPKITIAANVHVKVSVSVSSGTVPPTTSLTRRSLPCRVMTCLFVKAHGRSRAERVRHNTSSTQDQVAPDLVAPVGNRCRLGVLVIVANMRPALGQEQPIDGHRAVATRPGRGACSAPEPGDLPRASA